MLGLTCKGQLFTVGRNGKFGVRSRPCGHTLYRGGPESFRINRHFPKVHRPTKCEREIDRPTRRRPGKGELTRPFDNSLERDSFQLSLDPGRNLRLDCHTAGDGHSPKGRDRPGPVQPDRDSPVRMPRGFGRQWLVWPGKIRQHFARLIPIEPRHVEFVYP